MEEVSQPWKKKVIQYRIKKRHDHPTDPGFWTASLSTRTASSLLIFSKFMSFTCKIMSPGSILPSKATAPLQNQTEI